VESISNEAGKVEAAHLRQMFQKYDPQAIELATLAIKSEQQQGGLAGLSSERIGDLSVRVADARTALEGGFDRIVKARRAEFETTLDRTVFILKQRAIQSATIAM